MKIGVISFLVGIVLVFVGAGLHFLLEIILKDIHYKTISIMSNIFFIIATVGLIDVFVSMVAILVSAIYWLL